MQNEECGGGVGWCQHSWPEYQPLPARPIDSLGTTPYAFTGATYTCDPSLPCVEPALLMSLQVPLDLILTSQRDVLALQAIIQQQLAAAQAHLAAAAAAEAGEAGAAGEGAAAAAADGGGEGAAAAEAAAKAASTVAGLLRVEGLVEGRYRLTDRHVAPTRLSHTACSLLALSLPLLHGVLLGTSCFHAWPDRLVAALPSPSHTVCMPAAMAITQQKSSQHFKYQHMCHGC